MATIGEHLKSHGRGLDVELLSLVGGSEGGCFNPFIKSSQEPHF